MLESFFALNIQIMVVASKVYKNDVIVLYFIQIKLP